MKQLSESLEALAKRVAVVEESATAAFEADRAKLEKRHEEIETRLSDDTDKFEASVRDTAAAGRTRWTDTKATLARPFNELRTRFETRQSEHELHKALRAADEAEEDAVAAIDLAAYFLNIAEYAVVDAALARLEADDLAVATVGASS